MAKLLLAIQRLDKPEGQLDILKDRLADAERDLVRATQEDKPRIQAEIEQLKADIQALEKVIANPDAAAEQTQKNIEAGLERERKPEKPTAAQTSTKFINPPPGLAPNYFQDRYDETKEILRFLNDDAQRLMTIVGRGGVGKTAMVCRLLKGLEGGELPDGLGSMRVEGIVYLSESGSHRVNFANLFYDLCKLLPADAANALDAVYKNPQASTASKMSALLDRFTAGKVVLLLDNIEPLISVETFDIADAELDECLRALLHGAHSALKVILTTRVAPRGLNLYEPGRQRVLTLDSGLEQKYAVEMLREMDMDAKVGLKSADAEALKRAYERTLGFPRALEALFAILASDRYTTLDELLAMPTPVNVVEALVGEAFNRLDTNAQKVMQALAVYNRPVTPAAVDYLLAPHLPAMDSAPILQRLANMHFARKESGRFYLHPVDREFAFSLIPVGENRDWRLEISDTDESQEADSQSPFTQHGLTLRAADYFAAARKPRAEWKKLEDLSAQLAEFDLRCAAGDYDTAASVLGDFDYEYLLLWGHYRLMIEMNEKLQGKVKDKFFIGNSAGNLGSAYLYIGQVSQAIYNYEKALENHHEIGFRQGEGMWLGNLGNAYSNLGNFSKAIEFYEQALIFDREIGDRRGEGIDISNLGGTYAELGNSRKAIEFYEQALLIAREIGDRPSEANELGGIAACYEKLGEIKKAIEYLKNALSIAEEIGGRSEVGVCLSNLGSYYSNLDDQKQAKEYFEQSLAIAQETGYRYGEGFRLLNLAGVEIEFKNYKKATELALQSTEIGNEISRPHLQSNSYTSLALAYLLSEELAVAQITIEAALQYDVPENNHNASALHGIIALRQGDEVTARGAFVRALGQADEILSKTAEYYSALDAKGLALCGLTVVGGRLTADGEGLTTVNDQPPTDYRQQAIETFQKARKIAPHAGVVKSVLRLFDELVKCDKEGVLKDVRKAAEGK